MALLDWRDSDVARRMLAEYTTWAVVGISPDPFRDSNSIAKLLMAKGKRVLAVNPNADSVLGLPCYPSLLDLPEPVEVVDVFRRSDRAGTHVDEAIAIGAKAVWFQLGVVDEAAYERATAAGLEMVMDRCPAQDYPRFFPAA